MGGEGNNMGGMFGSVMGLGVGLIGLKMIGDAVSDDDHHHHHDDEDRKKKSTKPKSKRTTKKKTKRVKK
jgi:hypothetical protein